MRGVPVYWDVPLYLGPNYMDLMSSVTKQDSGCMILILDPAIT